MTDKFYLMLLIGLIFLPIIFMEIERILNDR